MRVLHRHPHIGVAGQLPGRWQRHARPEEPGDVGVAARGVEVGNALVRLVLDPRPGQILLDHQPRPAFGQVGIEQLI
ncbi:MAG: hypothetical protein SFU86_15930 [Pirellulaceae bacterium]|nr:hypothetical protein [Pirellulaceae bacterium]